MNADPRPITIVSGLPRSGTSLMMRMLDAGGLPALTDGIRAPDRDNPGGYFELERVKQLPKGDHAWLAEARGKAVKVISALLEHLPAGHEYRVIFMRRPMGEVLASQREMLRRRGEAADPGDDDAMTAVFARHLERIGAWLARRRDVRVLDVEHARLMAEPRAQAERVARFLGGELDVGRMAGVVDAGLHRQRSAGAERSPRG